MINEIVCLQKRSIKAIALTASQTGAWHDIKKIEKVRYHQLCKVGIDFSKSFVVQDIVFSALHDEKDVTMHPTFFHGILSATFSVPKGIVLAAFLKKGWIQANACLLF